ncbi:hypothetical protein KAR91_80535 [Candidatus Pacearchaeota archaeon]|nr:hypothetical protein [Candidatus Pacearchaeota archaeon]
MTTINGVTFNMKTLEIVSTHRNIPNEEIGTDESFITDMGYTGLVLRMTGYEKTIAKYDEVINEFMKSGGHALVHRTDWQFTVYSTQLVPLLDIGIVDNFFPYELVMLTSNPYRESSSLSCRAKEITANNEEWSAEDMPCNNLLDNWSFEDWTAGTAVAPDDWTLVGGGAAVARESTIIQVGTHSAKVTRTTADCWLKFDVPDAESYRGEVITLGAWVYATVSNRARLQIEDSVGSTISSYHTGNSTWQFLTISHTVAAGATSIEARMRVNNGDEGYFDGAVLIEGDSIPDNTFIRDIDTDGVVDAVPDIKVTGGAAAATYDRETGYSNDNTDATEYSTNNTNYVLKKTFTFTAIAHLAFVIDVVGIDLRISSSADNAYGRVTYQAASLNGGAETDLQVQVTGSESYVPYSWTDQDIQCAVNEQLVVRFYTKSSAGGSTAYIKNLDCDLIARRKNVCKNPQVYNTADTTVKSSVANEIDPDMVFEINTDGTGTIEYADDFSTTKYLDAHWDMEGVTHDAGNDELDIADDGFLSYKMDTKHTVTGIPTLTTQINITSGTPTIQISSDGTTWYDITTAIVDDVDTIYELDSSSLSLKGLTTFYWRIDCVKAGAATCSIKSFEVDVNNITIDVEHPKISATGVSTIRCDQHADSGLNCIVALIYRARSWAT